jgi:hypothetical protein
MLSEQGGGEIAVLPALTAVHLFQILRLYGLTVMLLVQCREDMAVLPAVTAGLLYHSAMDIWTQCNVASTGRRGNVGYVCSY